MTPTVVILALVVICLVGSVAWLIRRLEYARNEITCRDQATRQRNVQQSQRLDLTAR